jgi:hypothetical protein
MRSNLDANLANESDGVYTFRLTASCIIKSVILRLNMEMILDFVKFFFMDPDQQSEKRSHIFSNLDAAACQLIATKP